MTASPAAAAHPVPRFFSREQFAALRQLGDAILPASGGRPAASQTGAAEFLDFLIRESPKEIQKLYRDGLTRLARDGVTAATLAPLGEPWTYDGPKDPFARFLLQAKTDILQAAFNSKEWGESASRGSRSAGGVTNYYWRSLD